jgi:hypothetical protein
MLDEDREPKKSRQRRSAVTNGRSFPRAVDGRSAEARRWNDLHSALAMELGGEYALSTANRQLLRRAATLALLAEDLEAQLVAGEPIDPVDYSRVAGALDRILRRLGIKRPAPLAPPSSETLEQYVARTYGGKPTADDLDDEPAPRRRILTPDEGDEDE